MQISLSKKVAGLVGALVLVCGGIAQAQPGNGEIQKPAPTIVDSAPIVSGEVFSGGDSQNSAEINVGIGAYLIRPYWESNQAFSKLVSTTVGNLSTSHTQNTDFRYGTEAAPRVFAEYINCSGLGARISWWHYDQRASEGIVNIAPPPGTIVSISASGLGNSSGLTGNQKDTFEFHNRVVFDVWDLDITQRIVCTNLWQFTTGAGIRYAYISQTLDSSRIRTGLPAGAVNNAENHARNFFNGAGPDVLFETKRAVGCNGLALYGNARTGVLFGTSRSTSSTSTSNATGPGPVSLSVSTQTSDRNNDLIPFLETELGVEWQGSGRSAFQPFVRLGAVGQAWWGTGNAQTGGADANMGFFGGTVVAGFSY